MGINRPSLWLVAAFAWGFAEATFFFIVPDLLLTASLLVFGLSFAFRSALSAVVGAVIGGAVMYFYGAGDIEAARGFLISVPLLGPDLLARVQDELAGFWPLHLLVGAITGAPYKIYAVEAGAAAVPLWQFLLVSVAARFSRFALIILIVAGGLRLLRRFGFSRLAPYFLAGYWASIYLVYTAIRLGSA